MPAAYQGTQFRSSGPPIVDLKPPADRTPEASRPTEQDIGFAGIHARIIAKLRAADEIIGEAALPA